jgi:hypothetical protein
MRSAVGQGIQLGRAEAGQDREVALCVLVVDLDHAADEELLLLCGASLPVVGLGDCDEEALVAGPQLALLFLRGAGVQVGEVVDG